jgi:hypothetical protein
MHLPFESQEKCCKMPLPRIEQDAVSSIQVHLAARPGAAGSNYGGYTGEESGRCLQPQSQPDHENGRERRQARAKGIGRRNLVIAVTSPNRFPLMLALDA